MDRACDFSVTLVWLGALCHIQQVWSAQVVTSINIMHGAMDLEVWRHALNIVENDVDYIKQKKS